MEQNNITVFLDAIGRTIIGEVNDTKTAEQTIEVKNPAVISIVPNTQTGQITLQILPLFFKEFQAEKTEPTTWLYNKTNVTISKNFALDFRLLAQYNQLFASVPVQQSKEAPSEPPVIKLFDEE